MKKFIEAYEEDEAFHKKQNHLHKKHMIEDENIVVVEKNNIIKFSITSMVGLIRFVASVVLVILASIGLLCIIFDETRLPLINLLNDIVTQIRMEIS
ncbi:MAG: hypothetical protein ACI4GW_11905 [Lachnospiraceae bacterium]